MRLGYEPYATRRIITTKARTELLHALARIRPKMVRALASDVLPVFLEAMRAARLSSDPRTAVHIVTRWHTLGAARPASWPADLTPIPISCRWPTVGAPAKLGLWPELVPLANALKCWAATWLPRLPHVHEAAWVFDAALSLLDVWRRYPPLQKHPGWLGRSDSWWWPLTLEEETPPPMPKFPHEEWTDYRDRRVQKESAWKEQYEARLKKHEWLPTPLLRTKDGIPPQTRFEWLAHYLMGESYESIAQKYEIDNPDRDILDPETCRRAIARAWERVGLPSPRT